MRRSIWLDRDLFTWIEQQAKLEERKSSDMIRVLLRRQRASGGPVPS